MLAQERNYDAAILDLNLPGPDSLDVLRRFAPSSSSCRS